jgi:hypothetical protein
MTTLETLQPFVGPKVDVSLTPADTGWSPRAGTNPCELKGIDLVTNYGRPSGPTDPRLHIAPFPDDFTTAYPSPDLTYLFTVNGSGGSAAARVRLDPDPTCHGEFQIQE